MHSKIKIGQVCPFVDEHLLAFFPFYFPFWQKNMDQKIDLIGSINYWIEFFFLKFYRKMGIDRYYILTPFPTMEITIIFEI